MEKTKQSPARTADVLDAPDPAAAGCQFGVQVEFSLCGQDMAALVQKRRPLGPDGTPGGQEEFTLSGLWENKRQPLGIVTIAKQFGADLSFLKSWDIAIDRLALQYGLDNGRLDFFLHSANYGSLAYSFAKERWELLLHLQKRLAFHSIPLVGPCFDEKSGVHLKLLRFASFAEETQGTSPQTEKLCGCGNQDIFPFLFPPPAPGIVREAARP